MADFSLLPDEFNFLFWQGDTLNIQFTVIDDDDSPVDLSTYKSIRGQVRDSYGGKVADLVIVESDLANGVFQTFLQQQDSAALDPGIEYPFDVQLEGTKTIELVEYTTITTVIHGMYQVAKESTLESTAPFKFVQPGQTPTYTVHRRNS